jgi:hypothetical protein
MLNHIALHCVPMHIGWYFDKRDQRLCQNCVTCPPKPWGNIVIYGATLEQIVVAGSR